MLDSAISTFRKYISFSLLTKCLCGRMKWPRGPDLTPGLYRCNWTAGTQYTPPTYCYTQYLACGTVIWRLLHNCRQIVHHYLCLPTIAFVRRRLPTNVSFVNAMACCARELYRSNANYTEEMRFRWSTHVAFYCVLFRTLCTRFSSHYYLTMLVLWFNSAVLTKHILQVCHIAYPQLQLRSVLWLFTLFFSCL